MEAFSEFPEATRRALERARDIPLSYVVQVLRSPEGRLVAVLGEAHVKLGKAAEIGREVVSCFALRGVETFQRNAIFGGRALGFVIQAPRALLHLLSFRKVKGSTITDAKALPTGQTVEIERGGRVPFGLHVASVYLTTFMTVSFLVPFVPLIRRLSPNLGRAIRVLAALLQTHMFLLLLAIPLRRRPWSWVVHPLIGILNLRDQLMAEGTVRMLEDHPGEDPAVVVMGRAHVEGYTRILVERYGFMAA